MIPVLIPAGKTSVSVEVAILNDDLVEQSSEEFSVHLQLSSGGGGGEEVLIGEAGEGTVEVVDDDSKHITIIPVPSITYLKLCPCFL